MKLVACLCPALVVAALVMPLAAHAETSLQDAQRLEQQIRDWLSGVLGPHVVMGERPVQMSPEGDHYRLEIPLSGTRVMNGLVVTEGSITGAVRALDGDRWAIERLRASSPLRAANPTTSGAPRSLVIETADQNLHGVLDPSLATATSFDATLLGYVAHSDSENTTQTTRIGRAVTDAMCEPAGEGRVNILSTSTEEKLVIAQTLQNGIKMNVAADRLTSTGHMSGVSLPQVGVVIRSALDFGTAIADSAADMSHGVLPVRLPERSRPAARALVLALADVLGAAQQDGVIEGIHIDAAGRSANVRRLAIGGGFEAPDDMIDAHISVDADGIELTGIPGGPYRDYLPHHIVLQPRVSGIAAHALTNLVLQAIDGDAGSTPDMASDAAALLGGGPLHIGLDKLAMDLGPAELQATGGFEKAAANSTTGQAHIVATGFDALISKVSAAAELRRVLPMLFLLKGVARQDGDRSVWDVKYENGKLTVNDMDLSALAPTKK